MFYKVYLAARYEALFAGNGVAKGPIVKRQIIVKHKIDMSECNAGHLGGTTCKCEDLYEKH